MRNDILLQVVVRSREGTLFEGEAMAVSGENEAGAFDILPMHAQFVTTVSGTLAVHTARGDKEFPMERGLVQAKANMVTVFVGI